MKNSFLALVFVCAVFVFGAPAWGTCPEDPNDLGVCDSMFVEPWHGDIFQGGNGPFFVRVPIYVTNDVVGSTDSISAFVIPLCYTHTNPAKYCSVTTYWNNSATFASPRSIFRHLNSLVKNRMMLLYEQGEGREWDTKILNLDGTSHMWLAMVASGLEDQAWWEGNKVLLATMTFKLEDSMQVCIDTCFWPPGSSLAWSNSLGQKKVPRLGTPHDPASYKVCFNVVRYPFMIGDANRDGVIDIGDVLYLCYYLFQYGPAPNPLQAGDADCSGKVNVNDITVLLNYLYRGGPHPCP